VLLFQLLFTYLSLMQYFFATTAIGVDSWWRILAVGLVIFLAAEVVKMLVGRRIAAV
jgi:hypothetical protein